MADLASTRVFGTLVVAHRATVEGGQVWHSNNHGSGSGLDADLLDGHDSTYFATAADLNSHLHDDRYLQLTGGSVSGALSVSGSLTLGGNVQSTGPISFLNGGAAQAINTKELLVSNSYSHRSLVPTNGMYVAGDVKSGGTFHGVGSGLTGVNAASVGGKSISTIESDYAAADAATLASAKGYTDTSIAALVDSSPGTLDTLNELAAALGDDPNFATTISNQIGTKLDATAYTAADVLAKLKTVDGAGSLLDADTLDGKHASAFATAAHTHPVADITGLSDAATTTVAAIRSGTTKANVGLGSVRNVASYSQTEADAAFAPITHGHSVADITGLSDAATTTVAAIRSGTTAANVGLGSVRNVASYSQTESNDLYVLKSGDEMTGDLFSTGDIVAGKGSGSIGLTINDGNSNITFNHQDGTPDQSGNSGRIEVNTDAASDAQMAFELGSGVTGGVNLSLTQVLKLTEATSTFTSDVVVNNILTAGHHLRSGGLNLDRYTDWDTGSFDSLGGGAAIVNDSGTYKALMILGNRSAGGNRIIKMWDRLEVSGSISASSSVDVGGSVTLTSSANGLGINLGGRVGYIGSRNTSWLHYQSPTDAHYFYGTITAASNITAYSDIRVKKNLEIIPDALNKVSKLNGYTFDRVDEEGLRQTGVVAQEVEKVLPEAVVKDPETEHLHVAYGNLVGLLIEAIKEEGSHREALESRIAALESGDEG